MTAPSETPPCDCSMSDTFNDYYCVKQAWKCCKYRSLETALAESRAECERIQKLHTALMQSADERLAEVEAECERLRTLADAYNEKFQAECKRHDLTAQLWKEVRGE